MDPASGYFYKAQVRHTHAFSDPPVVTWCSPFDDEPPPVHPVKLLPGDAVERGLLVPHKTSDTDEDGNPVEFVKSSKKQRKAIQTSHNTSQKQRKAIPAENDNGNDTKRSRNSLPPRSPPRSPRKRETRQRAPLLAHSSVNVLPLVLTPA